MSEPGASYDRHAELIESARREAAITRQRAVTLRFDDRSGPLSDSLPLDPAAGRFTGYQSVREIRRGGQGVVYEAIHQATGRKVAVKVMREGPLAGSRERARFEREVRILAALDHPHIVTIHDSGAALGCFYYVMEFVDGLPLDEYVTKVQKSKSQKVKKAEGRKVEIAERLRLFAQVCEAVNAAHLRGVIHRDLKPGNVLIDAHGVPHVLDFGLAKVTDDSSDISRALEVTQSEPFLGSMPWASPEQAAGRLAEMSTRSDVYALGVMLHQVLADRFPYEVRGNVRDVVDNILRAEPARLSGSVPGVDAEVDTIVLKCLSKDASRRYDTAGALARDLRRYLAGEMIEARRDSSWYVLRKTLRRYRVPAGIALAFLAVVLASVVALSVMVHRATREREAALAAQHAEKQARLNAELEAEKANQIQQFLQQMLASVNPFEQRGRDVTVREVLDDAATRVATELTDQPQIEVAVRRTIGITYMDLGAYDAAEAQLTAALELAKQELGNEHPDTLGVMNGLAQVYFSQGRWAEAAPLYRDALAARRRVLGDEHEDTLVSLNNWVRLLVEQGKLPEAEPQARQVIEARRRIVGPDHPQTLNAMNNLASLLKRQARYEEAEPLFEETLGRQRETLGPHHPATLKTLNNLAGLCYARGELAKAEPLWQEALAALAQTLGEDHPQTTLVMHNLGALLYRQGKLEEAEALLGKALELRTRVLGLQHDATLATLNSLATVCHAAGQLDKAEELWRQAVETSRRVRGDGDPNTLNMMHNLAHVLLRNGKAADAEPFGRLAAEGRAAVLGHEHHDTVKSMHLLGHVLRKLERIEEAALWYGRALDAASGLLPPDDPELVLYRASHAQVLVLTGWYEEAEAPLREAHTRLHEDFDPDDERTREMVQSLIQLYEAWGKPDEADRWRGPAAADP